MAKGKYYPTEDEKIRQFLKNLNLKLPSYASTFGLTAAQLASVNADYLNFDYWLDQSNLFLTEKEERVSYKNLLHDGPLGTPSSPAPVVPAVAAPPAGILPGIEPRTREIVQQIKNHPNYTDTIGKDLGIIGDEQSVQKSALKPLIKLVQTAGG
ncbi:MAG: hypothetical protein HY841_09505, partial [Bacteroidetes bacterium]|nr:hypothetical protein [Bacteroidota bacterium]